MTSNTGIHTSSGNQVRLLKMKISNVRVKDKIGKTKAQNDNEKSLCKRKIKKSAEGKLVTDGLLKAKSFFALASFESND